MSKVTVTNDHIDDGDEFSEAIRKLLDISEGKMIGFIVIGVQEDEPFRNPVTGNMEFSPYVIRSNSHDVQLITHTLHAVSLALETGEHKAMSASEYREGKKGEGINISRPEG